MLKVLFLGEGTSDEGIAIHIERIATELDLNVQMTTPDMSMVPLEDRTVAGKLTAIRRLGGVYDLVFVHRDAGATSPSRTRSRRIGDCCRNSSTRRVRCIWCRPGVPS